MPDLNQIKGLVSGFPPWLLLGAGFVGGYLKSFWNFFYSHTIGWASKKFKIELVLEEQEHRSSFIWVNLWMEKHLTKRKIASLRVQHKSSEDGDSSDFELLPSYGFYWFWWKWKLLTFYSERKESSSEYADRIVRTVSITVWGTRKKKVLLDLLEEAKSQFDALYPTKMKYYVPVGSGLDSGHWESFVMEERRLESVYLPNKDLSNILADFQLFFDSKQKYRTLGVPWRRAYLLDGPPGSGKSTLVQALASHFKYPIYYMQIAGMTASKIKKLLTDAESPCIVLMEDIDSAQATEKRTQTDDKKEQKLASVTTSELLNLLDGLVATEQRIVIMTTNHPEKLDPAFTRPGRVDRKFHIGYAQDSELAVFHERAKELYDIPDFGIFREMLNKECTIADAQALVFKIQSEHLTNE